MGNDQVDSFARATRTQDPSNDGHKGWCLLHVRNGSPPGHPPSHNIELGDLSEFDSLKQEGEGA